jgi:hypothetical protein
MWMLGWSTNCAATTRMAGMAPRRLDGSKNETLTLVQQGRVYAQEQLAAGRTCSVFVQTSSIEQASRIRSSGLQDFCWAPEFSPRRGRMQSGCGKLQGTCDGGYIWHRRKATVAAREMKCQRPQRLSAVTRLVTSLSSPSFYPPPSARFTTPSLPIFDFNKRSLHHIYSHSHT